MTFKTITFQFCFDISNHSDWWKYFSLIAYEHNQMYGKVIGQFVCTRNALAEIDWNRI